MRFSFASLAIIVLVAMSGLAQEHTMPMPAATAVPLENGLGDLHFAVTTKNADAQRYFDQGMRYVYAFNHEAAVASFKRATELDPDLALGYWGQALALGPNINMDVDPTREAQAYDAEKAALAHVSSASPKERDLIDVLAKRYSNEPGVDLKKLSVDYSNGMRGLHAKYPDDPDIGALFAESLMDLHPWHFWSHDGKPMEGTVEIVSVLESVLAAHPDHMGANHYYIHAVEGSASPERALASANRLAKLAPSAGHLVHMPAHIYQRTGNYTGAADANAAGARADRDFMKVHGADNIYSMMYYNHNLDFGAASYAMAGQFDKAKEFADEESGNAVKIVKEMPPIDPFTTASLKVLLRFGKWNDILNVPDAAGPYSSAFRHFARGTAFARLGRLDEARAELKELDAARPGLSDDTGFMQNTPKTLASIASMLLEGQIAEASGKRNAAIAVYRKAVAAEDALSYDEPADWFYPTRETLGAALLRKKDYAGAEKVFRADLDRNPNNPRSLFGLSRALKGQKKPSAKADTAFKKNWQGGTLRVEDL
jgi:tetratricopeptide (TPR) repeat protein